jgi:hypothetical protein
MPSQMLRRRYNDLRPSLANEISADGQLEHDVTVFHRSNSSLDLRSYQRMGDSFEGAEFLAIIEHDCGEPFPVDAAVDDGLRPALSHSVERRTPGGQDLVTDTIRFDHNRPPRRKEFEHGRLPTADPATDDHPAGPGSIARLTHEADCTL